MKTLKIIPLSLIIVGLIIIYQPITTYADKGTTSNSNCDQMVADCLTGKNQNDSDKVTDVKEVKEKNTGQNLNTFTTFLKFLFALIFIVFLIYWLLKFINKQTRAIQNNRLVQTLGGVGLGPNRSVQVVKIGQKVMVLGVGENVQLLSEITDDGVLQEMMEASTQTNNKNLMSNKTFAEMMNKVVNQKDDGTTFKKLFNSQLSGALEKRKEMMNHFRNKGDQNE